MSSSRSSCGGLATRPGYEFFDTCWRRLVRSAILSRTWNCRRAALATIWRVSNGVDTSRPSGEGVRSSIASMTSGSVRSSISLRISPRIMPRTLRVACGSDERRESRERSLGDQCGRARDGGSPHRWSRKRLLRWTGASPGLSCRARRERSRNGLGVAPVYSVATGRLCPHAWLQLLEQLPPAALR